MSPFGTPSCSSESDPSLENESGFGAGGAFCAKATWRPAAAGPAQAHAAASSPAAIFRIVITDFLGADDRAKARGRQGRSFRRLFASLTKSLPRLDNTLPGGPSMKVSSEHDYCRRPPGLAFRASDASARADRPAAQLRLTIVDETDSPVPNAIVTVYTIY